MDIQNFLAASRYSDNQTRLDSFDDIFIEHPRLHMVVSDIGNLMVQTQSKIERNEWRSQRAGGRPIQLDGLFVTPLLGPSGSGKSSSLSKFVDAVYASPDVPSGDIPVLYVTLRSSTLSTRQLQAQVLEAFGAPQAETVMRGRDYSEALVNDDIRTIARRRRTSVVIIDEVHNCLAAGLHVAPKMAKAFKSFVNDGVFSLVLSGTHEALPLLTCDSELVSRQRGLLDFGPFSLEAADVEYFLSFVSYLETEMVNRQIIQRPIGLTADVEACATTYEIAEGVIGIVSRIVRLALDRQAQSNRNEITWAEIASAYRAWRLTGDGASGSTHGRRDPFVKGPQDGTLKAMAAALGRARKAA